MYKVSAKRNGKWWTFGTIKKNKFDNLQLSMKNTGELKELILLGGEWLNFSLFDDEEKPKDEASKPSKASKVEDDEQLIPF